MIVQIVGYFILHLIIIVVLVVPPCSIVGRYFVRIHLQDCTLLQCRKAQSEAGRYVLRNRQNGQCVTGLRKPDKSRRAMDKFREYFASNILSESRDSLLHGMWPAHMFIKSVRNVNNTTFMCS